MFCFLALLLKSSDGQGQGSRDRPAGHVVCPAMQHWSSLYLLASKPPSLSLPSTQVLGLGGDGQHHCPE